MRLRRLNGRMSVQASLIQARQSCLSPLLPASRQPSGFSRSAGQIEYCSSWFTTTLYVVVSSFSSWSIPVLLRSLDRPAGALAGLPVHSQRRGESRGGTEVLEPPAVGPAGLAFHPQQARRLAGGEGHVEAVERPREPLARRLDERLLAGPTAEEGARPLGLGH